MRVYEITIRYVDTEDPSASVTDRFEISADSLESYPFPTKFMVKHCFPAQWKRFWERLSSYREFLSKPKTNETP